MTRDPRRPSRNNTGMVGHQISGRPSSPTRVELDEVMLDVLGDGTRFYFDAIVAADGIIVAFRIRHVGKWQKANGQNPPTGAA
jgi:hypothetical protein